MLLLLAALSALAGVAVGDPAPALPEEVAGQVVLVNVWATWCAPCRAELPRLDALHARLPEGASVLTINIDRARRPAEGLVRHLRLDLPVLWDTANTTVAAWDPPGLPATWLVDASGKVRAVYVGELDAEALARIEAEMRALLPGAP